MIIKEKVTLQIYYYHPDYRSLIQEFLWQTMDEVPELYRVHRFLNYWQRNIEAVIQEINVAYRNEHKVL